MIGVGLLGSGFIGDCYADSLLDVRNAELVACFSRSAARSNAFAAKWGPGIADHPTMDALCADPRVDIVVIAMPNEAHLKRLRRRSPRQGDDLTKRWPAPNKRPPKW